MKVSLWAEIRRLYEVKILSQRTIVKCPVAETRSCGRRCSATIRRCCKNWQAARRAMTVREQGREFGWSVPLGLYRRSGRGSENH